MEKRGNNQEESLEQSIERVAKEFLKKTENKEIKVISHFDTDGITSASIMLQTLKKMDKSFSVQIIKGLEKEFIY